MTEHDTAVQTLAALWQLIEEQQWDRMCQLLDPAVAVHYVHTGEVMDADGFIQANRDYPGRWHVHVADSNRRAPGWGHLDFGPVVRTLAEMRYGGFLSAEILPQPGVLDAAWQTIGTMRRLVPRTERRAPRTPDPANGQASPRT